MDCKFCETKMIKTKSYGDGWIEPLEEYFTCPKCGAELEYNQGYYENPYYWINGNGEPDKSDDTSEDETSLFIKMTKKQIKFSKTNLLLCYAISLIIIGYGIIKYGGING